MNDRYPHLHFLIDAAPALAGGAGLLVLCCGTVRSCHTGGAVGFVSFLLAIVVALLAYVVVRAGIELLSVLLELESMVRDRPPVTADTGSTDPLRG